MRTLGLIFRLIRPLFLLGAALVFALGAGIARYLGAYIDWDIYIIGQAWVTVLQISTHLLNEYYDAPQDRENPNRTPFSGGSGVVGPDKIPRQTVLIAALGSLAIVASITVLLIWSAKPSPATVFFMVLIFAGAFFYSVPPVRLATTGYGELTTSILVANLLPSFSFLLQTGELHRLIAMSTFPLTALHLAMILAFEFPDYFNDIKFEKTTLLVRVGWQRGMNLHNILILIAYLLLALAAIFGLPLPIVLPAMFVLPLGALQIWQMRRIAVGAKPNWIAVTITPLAMFAITAYLLTFSFWTR
jgi:1,4-dihydroxy-2-naphthoate octaprenyltransferase